MSSSTQTCRIEGCSFRPHRRQRVAALPALFGGKGLPPYFRRSASPCRPYCPIRGPDTLYTPHDGVRANVIPFNKPFIIGDELQNISRAVREYSHLSGDGVFTRQCQKWIEERLVCRKALLTHSCTAALEMAAILCNIQPGDEVVMPSFTFVSTANAFVLRGGTPVFIDIRPDTLNMDEDKIERAVTKRTKAVVPVHYAGIPCSMDKIDAIAKHYNLFVIEDAAQALLSTYRGKALGSIGDLGALSFHETKNVISGEGGALLINREEFFERANIIREKGTNRDAFFRGEIDKYTWVDIGSSYMPGDMVAAFLIAQLNSADDIVKKRRNLFRRYYGLLEPFVGRTGIRLPLSNSDDSCNSHIFYIITNSAVERRDLLEYLKRRDITAVFHYIPLHSSPAGKRYGRASGKLFHTDDLSGRLIRLPLYYEMKDKDVERVVNTIVRFYDSR